LQSQPAPDALVRQRSYCAPDYGQFSGQCHAYDSTRSSAEFSSFTVGRSAYKYLHPG